MDPLDIGQLRKRLLLRCTAVFSVAALIVAAVLVGALSLRENDRRNTELQAYADWLASGLALEPGLLNRLGPAPEQRQRVVEALDRRVAPDQQLNTIIFRSQVDETRLRFERSSSGWHSVESSANREGLPTDTSATSRVVRRPLGSKGAWAVELAVQPSMGRGAALQQFATVLLACLIAFAALAPAVVGIFSQLFRLLEDLGLVVTNVLERESYTSRAQSLADPALDRFVAAFNGMLALIEQRDGALEQARADLERRIRERTADLELALNRVEMTAAFLRDRENLLRTVLDAAADGVIVSDAAATIVSANRAAGEMLGSDPEALRGSALAPLFALGQRGEDGKLAGALNLGIMTGVPLHKRCRLFGRNGEQVLPLEVAISEVQANEQLLYAWIVRDVSELVSAEERRVQAAEAHAAASHAAGRAEMAAGVLHNVGNILNSVNTSAALLRQRLHSPALSTLRRVSEFMCEHVDEQGVFIANDERGRAVAPVLGRIVEHLQGEWKFWREELDRLAKNIDHINEVVASHQAAARGTGAFRRMSLEQLVASVLTLVPKNWIDPEDIVLSWGCAMETEVEVDLHKVLQILVNLVKNAAESVREAGQDQGMVQIIVADQGGGRFMVRVTDNGIGIASDDLARIFSHGFTTKDSGHGFGLHNSANAATEMGGSLTAASDGPGRGASFTLILPGEQPTVRRSEVKGPSAVFEIGRTAANGE